MIKYICIILVYYALPTLFKEMSGLLAYLFLIAPLASFLCALFPSMKYGYELLFPLSCGILFIPSALLYFNETAIIYGILYAACAFFGSVLGGILRARFLNEKKTKVNH